MGPPNVAGPGKTSPFPSPLDGPDRQRNLSGMDDLQKVRGHIPVVEFLVRTGRHPEGSTSPIATATSESLRGTGIDYWAAAWTGQSKVCADDDRDD